MSNLVNTIILINNLDRPEIFSPILNLTGSAEKKQFILSRTGRFGMGTTKGNKTKWSA